MGRLTVYVDLLGRWNKAINLVGPSTMVDPWRRHIADSLQLIRYLPESKNDPENDTIADLGAGAGLPGMVLAIVTGRPVTLIDSHQKKATFLQTVSRETQTGATVLCKRIEDVLPLSCAAIVSRALAPLSDLIALSRPHISPSTVLLFPKGDRVEEELTESAKKWIITHTLYPSDTDPRGRIVVMTDVKDAS